MLTPEKILELAEAANKKHIKGRLYHLSQKQKEVMVYIAKQLNRIVGNNELDAIKKVNEMTNLLEGFIRYLNDTHTVLKLDVERILTYIYYPESEEFTLDNKDNLMIGSKGETVRLWHDAYFMNNQGPILNRLIDCKNVFYDKVGTTQYIKEEGIGMPIQMQKKYEEMFAKTKRQGPSFQVK